MRTGFWGCPPLAGSVPFADLEDRMAPSQVALERFTPDEVNDWSGKDLDRILTHGAP